MIIGQFMKPAYFIIWFSLNINFRFSIKWYSRAQKVIWHKYVKYTCSMKWKQYNKMAVLHFFLVNSLLIYILFSLVLQIPSIHFCYFLSINLPLSIYICNFKSVLLIIYLLSINIYPSEISMSLLFIFVTFYVFTWKLLIFTFI